jgi:hypothetical protein
MTRKELLKKLDRQAELDPLFEEAAREIRHLESVVNNGWEAYFAFATRMMSDPKYAKEAQVARSHAENVIASLNLDV